jgi:hypothetical protein
MHEVGILCNKILEAAARDDWSTYEKLVDEMMSYILRRLRIFGQRDKLRADRSKGRETWA